MKILLPRLFGTARPSLFVAVSGLALLTACTPKTTTLRFVSNREAVMVQNPENPKPGDRLEVLVGFRKKVFFYVTRGASVTSLNASVDPVIGGKKLLAELSIEQHSIRVFIMQLPKHLPIYASPTLENKASISSDPTIAKILGGASTEIVGVGRGSWIATSAGPRRLFLRPIDSDLVVLIDTDGLDAARSADFVLRIGSLTFETSQ